MQSNGKGRCRGKEKVGEDYNRWMKSNGKVRMRKEEEDEED